MIIMILMVLLNLLFTSHHEKNKRITLECKKISNKILLVDQADLVGHRHPTSKIKIIIIKKLGELRVK